MSGSGQLPRSCTWWRGSASPQKADGPTSSFGRSLSATFGPWRWPRRFLENDTSSTQLDGPGQYGIVGVRVRNDRKGPPAKPRRSGCSLIRVSVAWIGAVGSSKFRYANAGREYDHRMR